MWRGVLSLGCGLLLGASMAPLFAAEAPAMAPAVAAPPAAAASAAAGMDALRQEVNQRSQALVQQGFNLTVTLGIKGQGAAPLRLGLLLPPHAAERRLSLWLAVQGGEARATLRSTTPSAPALLSFVARQGETTLQRQLPPGAYELELDGGASAGGYALLGVKGPALLPPKLDAARTREIAAAPSQGFHWPYYLYLPQQIRSPHLLVVPNNSGFVSDDVGLLRAAAAGELNRQAALAEQLGVPLLVPSFPRPADPDNAAAENLYLHALSRAAMLSQVPRWQRVDRQLLAMIDDARERLKQQGTVIQPRVLMSGFSASGSFVNRFAFLHPERVLALASGSPGGWPLAPVASVDSVTLNYPVGTADLDKISGAAAKPAALKAVASFIYMGQEDENDAVVYRDSFSAADEQLIFEHFGRTPLARWQRIAKLYAEQGLNARFQLYAGAAHSVTPQMQADIAAFFAEQLAAVPR
ncbi:hypothetical protein RQP53_13745 [Paucibacter sp. APW11]|uniref:Uncharacterized protein n=1 Tax=Roseateles aquae TaxID=3077235 RepID=A0ABU3PCN6_9BURK|nr:hypothetical protein [Paucibacter sp. APW11]MDT9000332.1 hypothetical protein [Paucibacter sp. APW11]